MIEGYIREKLHEITRLEIGIAFDRDARLRLRTANRSGGQLIRTLRYRNQPIVVELARRAALVARERESSQSV